MSEPAAGVVPAADAEPEPELIPRTVPATAPWWAGWAVEFARRARPTGLAALAGQTGLARPGTPMLGGQRPNRGAELVRSDTVPVE
ncbi:MAG TPA: hypothetical protein VFS29_13780, partial [Motilibacteraceae bacterium]|nr:hypothetical protein [Motilibacteraceae bacterium]